MHTKNIKDNSDQILYERPHNYDQSIKKKGCEQTKQLSIRYFID